MRSLLILTPLLLAACAPRPEAQYVIPDSLRATVNSCLAELCRPPLPETVTDTSTFELTPEQQVALNQCIASRG